MTGGGPTCLLIYGVERPELWGGSCGPVTVTLRHKDNFVDLSKRGRVIWGTYVSGFHVARLVVKLADGRRVTWVEKPDLSSGGSPCRERIRPHVRRGRPAS